MIHKKDEEEKDLLVAVWHIILFSGTICFIISCCSSIERKLCQRILVSPKLTYDIIICHHSFTKITGSGTIWNLDLGYKG